ncbi:MULTISPECIES: hypothetical protein [unclassified Paenibacillus]|uniref:hypothetical protein n=1 Tax=unclassified Paenibacillus TaxID=185978 RepID=UPI002404DBAB|nr:MULTISPECIES: hypothetical protein [unclassified Paenibacillus]MDF9843614.1 hypothetical protein [Paenibacillus sp. PastF-2]MDF9850203.1 hypothetical protein [Paenibacillus sp. PastM-2]MDF9856857.1 hypothetical protein [Paenibacillus sp. PastF-1]MDH6482050.1 hypothetical protein [Paenibacillus sp. PastH-2]MDH6509474.1 hypothetical protein [Paenibacillus sp. PastM-3]
MKKALLITVLLMVMILNACSNNSSAPASEEEVQETVQNFYNEMTKFDEMGKSSLENFNTTLTSYSTGAATDKELEEALDSFQDTASDIADQVKDVEISKSLPENIETLLRDAAFAFQSAYSIKEQASQSAASPEVTADEFNAMNQQADVAMLYGISKVNQARVAVGLLDEDSAAETELGTVPGTVVGTEADAVDTGALTNTSTE